MQLQLCWKGTNHGLDLHTAIFPQHSNKTRWDLAAEPQSTYMLKDPHLIVFTWLLSSLLSQSSPPSPGDLHIKTRSRCNPCWHCGVCGVIHLYIEVGIHKTCCHTHTEPHQCKNCHFIPVFCCYRKFVTGDLKLLSPQFDSTICNFINIYPKK